MMKNLTSPQNWNGIIRYAVAPVAVALGLGCRFALNPYLHNASPFTLFYLAILGSAWLGGLGPGILATVLSLLVADYFYLEPLYTILGGGLEENIQIVLFLIIGVVISLIVARLRREKGRAEVATRAARAGEAESRQAEDALRESETRFRGTFENAAIGMTHVDLNGNWLRVNQRFCDLLGYSCEELQGRKYWDLTHPEDVYLDVAPYTELIHGKIEHYDLEKRYITKDGRVIWVYVSRALQRDDQGKPLYTITNIVDITERKRTEASLQKANERLAEADRHKDEFLAMLGHELRNPLAPISNAMQLLGLLNPVEPRQRRQHEIIARQVTHLVRLVDDLLDVSRITRGKIELKREVVDLVGVVTRAIESVQPLLESRRHSFETCLPDEPLFALADPVRVAQVVANLLNNAAKYTDEGGHIWVSADRLNHMARIQVHDNGSGIRTEVLPLLFDLFSQAERTLDRAQGGLGIGLFLVRRLVELHGGMVQAWSRGLGHGSLFIVYLPVLPENGASPAPDALSAMAPESGTLSLRDIQFAGRVLVVDDNVDQAGSLAELLEIWGLQVQTLHNGLEVLDTARTFRPAVILLDIGLPGMNGYEVARQLRQDPATQGITLVALTGYGQDEDRSQAYAAGFDQHLVKPISPDVLHGLLVRTFA